MSKNFSDNNQPNHNKYKICIFVLGILVAVLAVGNVWAVFYYVPKNLSADSAGKNKFNLLNPARDFFKQDDLIINFQPLRDYLNDKYGADQNVSIYFEYLSTGSNITINKDAEFWPASLLKIPVAMAVVKKIEKKEWRWDNKLVLMAADKDDTFGDLHKEPTGSIFTIEELVRRSLTDSDNTANVVLLRNLEVKEITDVYYHIGLSDFLASEGKISAKKYSTIFRSLYNSSYMSEENSQKLISFLTRTAFNEYLASALPEKILFAHKIGIDNIKNVYLDSGIVYAQGRPYILTVMIQSKNEQTAKNIFKDISEKAYNYVKDHNK